ncbi:serine hydrolase domain-containing protein [Nakamurella lactea]|uniref:serine hydrolase domain-containing protein n=1 Tax=Nakamurella lactea TaxID=459515 RepID=UPI0004139D15|nr:serine hydrolase domain-containing protein [Nakamurella lactea]
MSKLDQISEWIAARLPELIAENKVPGAAVAVYAGGEIVDHAAGVLSKATGVEATPDSVFQIGSITKVWTTTLAMQLVDEGKLDLEATVRSYLPEFKLGDEDAAARITVRQLMCHVSGFEGDLFNDTGNGEDAVAKYLATLVDTPQLFEVGEMFSYNNAAFSVLGRVVEVLRGKPYDACLKEHLFAPLNLTHAAPSAWEAILYRAAVGHIERKPGAEIEPAPAWALVRSNAPAGSMLAMRPRDLVTFAAMHLREGRSEAGDQVLSSASVKAMQQRQVELPDLGLMGNAWGLGWEIFDMAGGTVIGHDGGTIGQSAFLRAVPGRDVAVAVLTNGGGVLNVYYEIVSKVLAELADIELSPLPTVSGDEPTIDAARYVGSYSSSVSDSVVSQDEDGRVWVQVTPKGIFAELGTGESEKVELVLLRGDTLIAKEPVHGLHMPHAFVGDDGAGHAQFLHTGRADRRVAD